MTAAQSALSEKASENARVLSEYLSAWVAGDVEKGTSFYSDKLHVHVAGRSCLAGTYRSKDEFRSGYIDRVLELTDGHWEIIGARDVLASDDRAMALVDERFHREGKGTLEMCVIAVYTIANGRITGMWVWDDDPYAMDEMFPPDESG